MLVLITLFWGISYWLTRISLLEVAPFMLNALRFLIAFGIALIFAFQKIRTVNLITLKYSVIIGVTLLFVYIGATFGVQYTSLSNAGFLCALTVVITPVLSFMINKKKPGTKLSISVGLSLIGIALLTLKSGGIHFALGDWFCIMAAFAYAIDLIITESAVKKEEVNAFQLGVFQLGVTGVLNFIFAWFTEAHRLPHSISAWSSVLFLAIFCTGIAFVVQSVAQQYTTASHVGVIYSLEPVFAGIVAFIFAGEVLSIPAYFGAFLLISSLFIMELEWEKHVTGFKSKISKFIESFQKN